MKVKSHLIQIGQKDEYKIKWVSKLSECNPTFNKDNLPTFVIISSKGRLEISTLDMCYLTERAKSFTYPRGKEALTSDKAFIYIKEEKEEKLLGVCKHYHIREFAPMFDEVDEKGNFI